MAHIESFDVVLLEPNASLNGFMVARGTAEQIDALRADDEFRRNSIDAALIVDDPSDRRRRYCSFLKHPWLSIIGKGVSRC